MDSHNHIKAYIILLVSSLAFVLLLVYLFTPFHFASPKNVSSQALQQPTSNEEGIKKEDVGITSNQGERIRLTTLLLTTEKELQTLENTLPSTEENQRKIKLLQLKTTRLKKAIEKITE